MRYLITVSAAARRLSPSTFAAESGFVHHLRDLQRELAGKDGKGPQVADPVVEPEGRAPEGEAYQA